MSDYISRAAAVAAIVAIRDELTEKKAYGWEWEYNGLNYAIQALPLPAADVEPVRHGEWIGSGDGYWDGELIYDMWDCSVCGYRADSDEKPYWYAYCPNCGAKMNGGDHDA